MPDRYILCTYHEPADLAKAVNDLIKQGYEPCGGVTITYGPIKKLGSMRIDGSVYTQAMLMTPARVVEWEQA